MTGDRLQRALELAYRYLDDRDRTVAEMRRQLAGRGLGGEEIDGAVQALIADGYLDDARFARLFAQDKRELQQWGQDRIRRALLQRGLDRELVDDALQATSCEPELERAVAVLRSRLRCPPRDRRERDRALGVLIRKGYDGELALEALAAYARDAGLPDSL
ncbi:MAG: RecX family transcriptional regulator [Solirubrobacteraceae bacterium]|jgi:regulatory protein